MNDLNQKLDKLLKEDSAEDNAVLEAWETIEDVDLRYNDKAIKVLKEKIEYLEKESIMLNRQQARAEVKSVLYKFNLLDSDLSLKLNDESFKERAAFYNIDVNKCWTGIPQTNTNKSKAEDLGKQINNIVKKQLEKELRKGGTLSK